MLWSSPIALRGRPTNRQRGAGFRRSAAARLLPAGFFLIAAVSKLAGADSQIHTCQQIGARQALRYFVGVAELAGAIGLIVTPLAALAAVGLALDMAGASVVNAAILHSPAIVLTVLLCIGLVVLARKLRPVATTRTASTNPDAMTGATR